MHEPNARGYFGACGAGQTSEGLAGHLQNEDTTLLLTGHLTFNVACIDCV